MRVPFNYLHIQFGFLKLEIFFLAPRLLSLLNSGHGVDLDVAIIDNFVTVFVPADADRQGFA